MARRSTPTAPEDRSLSLLEMRSGIGRLTRRIEELQLPDPHFFPSAVCPNWSPLKPPVRTGRAGFRR
jgi:hypothetical protein